MGSIDLVSGDGLTYCLCFSLPSASGLIISPHSDTDEHADSQTPEPSSASRQALKTAQNGTNEVLKATKGKAKDLLNAMGVDPKDVALPESPMYVVRDLPR